MREKGTHPPDGGGGSRRREGPTLLTVGVVDEGGRNPPS